MLKKQQAVQILERLRGDLKRLLDDENTLAGSPAFLKWHYDAETALVSIFPTNQRHLERFRRICFEPMPGIPPEVTPEIIRAVLAAPRQAFVVGIREAEAILHSITEEVRTYWSEDGTSLNPHGLQPAPKPPLRLSQLLRTHASCSLCMGAIARCARRCLRFSTQSDFIHLSGLRLAP